VPILICYLYSTDLVLLSRSQWVRTLNGKEIQIETRKPHSINTDGEITSTTPAMFRVIPAAIGVYIPRQETQF